MVVKVFEKDGVQYQYETEDYIAEDGVRFSGKWPYDPVLLEELQLRTKEDVLRYWIEHRDSLPYYTKDLIASNMEYFTERSFEECHTLGIRGLSRWINREEPALRIMAIGEEHAQHQPILLGTLISPNSLHVFSSIQYGGRMYFRPQESSVWTNHWNYSYTMDSVETNWYRRTKKDCKDVKMFGLELEVSTKLSTSEIQSIVTEVEPKQDPFFIFKRDGSVTGRYVHYYELVTVPCSPRYLRQEFKKFFNKLERLCAAKGLAISDVFDTGYDLNNGLHIHVSKDAFVTTGHEKRFLAAWNMQDTASSKLFQALSKRPFDYKSNQYCCPSDEGLRSLAYRLRQASWRHRGVCHSRNNYTREVRIFQGIFDLNHILCSIDTVEAMVDFTNMCSLRLLVGNKYRPSTFAQTFKAFVFGEQGYAKLKEEIKCA